MRNSFGDRLKAAREAVEVSQNTLARRINLTRQAISKLESQAVDPSWSTVQLIVKALGIDYADLEDANLEAVDYEPVIGRPKTEQPEYTPGHGRPLKRRKGK